MAYSLHSNKTNRFKVGYNMGKDRLNLSSAAKGEVLVLEDSPAGIRAGKSAGCKVLAVVTTHTAEQVAEAGADWVVKDLRDVKLVGSGADGGVELEFSNLIMK
jgi:glycerol 3-phosphatase-1